jgi:hypothetical protein
MHKTTRCLGLLMLAGFALGLHIPAAAWADSGELGPAFRLGANPVYGPAREHQWNAAAAYGTSAYLVVWSDPRNGSSYDIYGGRVSAGGAVLDPAGIAITTTAPNQEDPAVAFDGTNYLVVWKDARNGVSCDIYGARVSADGVVIDSAGIAVSLTDGAQGDVVVAFGDTAFLVVWTDTRNEVSNIYGARVTREGVVLDPAGIAICIDPGGQSLPTVAFDGSEWLVAWQDVRDGEPDIYGARVGTDGTVLDPLGMAIASEAGDQTYVAAASNGAAFLVVWDDKRSGSSRDVYGSRVGADGTVLDPGGILMSAAAGDQQYAAVTFDGASYFVVWNDLRNVSTWDLYATRVDSSGAVLDPAGIPVSVYPNQEASPTVAANGENFLVAWHDSRNGQKDVYAARVAADGTVLDTNAFPVSTSATYQAYPAVTFDGSDYLAVWQEWRVSSAFDIFGVRLAEDGTVLDTLGIAVSVAARDQLYPAVAQGADTCLVVWQDYRNNAYDVYGARVSADGSVLEPSGLAISVATGAQEFPDVASDGSGYLAVWQDKRSGGYDIYAARVSSAGTVLDPGGIAVCVAGGDQLHPTVAFDGDRYLVVWQDYRAGNYDIYCARVATDGTLLDPTAIVVTNAAGAQEWPAIAFDGTSCLAVWQDCRNGPYADIYGARVSPAGTVLDAAGIAISRATNEQLGPAVAFDGYKYFVAWQDKRSASTAPDIYGTKLDTAGTVLDPSGIIVAKVGYTQFEPAVSAAPSGQILVAYSSFVLPPVYGSFGIWANFYESHADVPGGTGGADAPWLCQNFPNPFAGSTAVRFYLPADRRVSVGIYDVRGRLLRTLADGTCPAGVNEIRWDGTSTEGGRAAPGIYFLRLEAGNQSQVRKVTLLR